MPPPKTLWPFFWHFLKPHPVSLGVFVLVALVWSVELSVSPYLLKLIIDGVSQQTAIFLPVILYASMTVIINLNFRIYNYVALKLAQCFYTDMTTTLYRYTSQHAYRYFQENFAGSIANKILYLPRDLEQILQIINTAFIPKTLAILVACGMLSLIHWQFSVVLLIWIVLFVGLSARYSLKSAKHAKVFSKACNELDGKLVDSLTHIITAKIFSNVGYESERIRTTQLAINQKYETMEWYNLKIYALQGIGVTILVGTMLLLLIQGRAHGFVTVGDFAFVLMLSSSIIMNVWQIGQNLINFTRNVGRCEDALGVLNLPHEIKDSPSAKPLRVSAGKIEFKQVDFRYHSKTLIFSKLSITIAAGQKVGLVGFSGGGKSTFLMTILRLFDIHAGAILIDDQSIADVTRDSLRRQIAFIPQDPELFHRTVFENIQYGNLSASKAEVITAAKKAHCHEFIEQLPDRYDALVGERGIKLSGGQRQRIAIARAILKDAPILILDEATAALDSVTEKYIQASLHKIMQHKTTLVIAHRLSTLLEMDRILFFQDGQIIEDGTLKELRQRNGLFANLWNHQNSGYLPQVADSPPKI